jgi:putative transposase
VEILQRIERKEMLRADEQYSPSTYRRWRKAIVEGKSKGMSAVEALIDFASDRGFRGDHIETGLSGLVNGLIKNGLENRLHQSVLAMYFDIEKQVRSAGYQMIAKSSFYERVSNIRSIETISRSEGHKASYQLEPVYWMLDMETPIHCERAMELVHVDSTLLDVELRSSISGEVLGRPWLTIAICAYSRRVVGMHLSFRPPSYVSTMMVLADVIRRTGRLPDAVIHDWGSEFKAKDWKYLLTALFIVRHVRPKSAPRFGAVLERLFGIVTRELIDNIAGNTKLRRNVRQLSPSHDPSTHSGLYLSDIYCGLEEYFFSIYDGTKHPATLQSPKERYDNSFVTHGARLDRVRRFDDLLPILMPTIKGRSRAVDRARGVVVNYRHYGNPILATMNVHAAAPVLKAVPFDPGIILAFVNGDWVICKSDVYTELRHAPDVVRRSLFEEWLIEQRIAVSAHDERRRSVRGLIERLNERAMQNKEYWRDREYQKFVAVSDVGPCDNSDDNGSIAELDKMMQKALVVARGIGSAGHLVMVSK